MNYCSWLIYHDASRKFDPRVLVQELRRDRDVVWQAGGSPIADEFIAWKSPGKWMISGFPPWPRKPPNVKSKVRHIVVTIPPQQLLLLFSAKPRDFRGEGRYTSGLYRCIDIRYFVLHCISLHFIALHYNILQYIYIYIHIPLVSHAFCVEALQWI